jgi:ribonucleoside-diphosphate reductase alpha chain
MQPKSVINDADITNRIEENIGSKGLKIKRHYTKGKADNIYEGINFEIRTSKIVNTDGTVVFENNQVEVPENWSQVATDILAQKYFRRKGVPQKDLQGNTILDKDGNPVLGGEKSIKETAHRLAGTWRYWGEKYGYFNRKSDAQAFEDEVELMIVNQIAVPNSPQWFNTGLAWAYGITGKPDGHFFVNPETEKVEKAVDSYTRPQPHACFIQNIEDNLMNEDGIFSLVTKEARLFKYGSGTGTNFSKLRGVGEPLSGGGASSGVMSFLNILDAGAGAILSGGTTRRAAKMVILDADHPEIFEFINWKVKEEQKVASMVTGSHINRQFLNQIVDSAYKDGIDPEKNPELKSIIKQAKSLFVPLNYIKRVLMMVENGLKPEEFDYQVFDTDFRSEAYRTVGGQNSNNTVRVTNEFMRIVEQDKDWNLIQRVDGKVYKTVKANELWKAIQYSAWASADPGIQFHTTVNEWHTCPNDGEIRASNPCSEYMFLDETACNLYQINLGKFYNDETGMFDAEAFRHVVRLSTIILEISVLMAQLPSRTMAIGTYNYRTLGLGFANLGSVLMRMGLAYEDKKGYAFTGAISSIMTGESYATSAEMAAILGTFKKYDHNKQDMLRVIRNHRRAAYNSPNDEYENLTIFPVGLDERYADKELTTVSKSSWDYALALGEKYGYRNAQTTAIAPTGTTGLVMDCDTTGLEPDFALVKFKKLVGGGYFKIINKSIEPALRKLGYNEDEITSITQYAIGHQTLKDSPSINHDSLKEKGFTDEVIQKIEAVLPTIFELKYGFGEWILGKEFMIDKLGIKEFDLMDAEFDLLKHLGYSTEEIRNANEYVCGTMTLEGAPYLRIEHLAVFDCANKCGEKGNRFISYDGHINQMAAAQPFISGAISKTINMPEEATEDEIGIAYKKSWGLMLKANAIYRDCSKLSQPLNTGSSSDSVYSKLFDFSDDLEDNVISPEVVSNTIQNSVKVPARKVPPLERHSITHKFTVGGHTGYITVGLYEDGNPCEIFITMNKEGSTLSGIMDAWATSLSFGLQYGVPLEEYIRKLVFMRFEPSGLTGNSEIPIAQSIVDYIGRWLAMRFLGKDVAKKYHNPDLVDKSYNSGTNSRILIPYINGKGHTEIKEDLSRVEKKEITKKSFNSVVSKVETLNQSKSSIDFALEQQQLLLKQNNDDAPACATCGSITVRNGACYKCVNCGATTGCS